MSRKVAYRPRVRFVDVHAGIYDIASEKDPQQSYRVELAHTLAGHPDVAPAPTCTCPAGENEFRWCKTDGVCKHVLVARYWARMIAALHKSWLGAECALPALPAMCQKPATPPAHDAWEDAEGIDMTGRLVKTD